MNSSRQNPVGKPVYNTTHPRDYDRNFAEYDNTSKFIKHLQGQKCAHYDIEHVVIGLLTWNVTVCRVD